MRLTGKRMKHTAIAFAIFLALCFSVFAGLSFTEAKADGATSGSGSYAIAKMDKSGRVDLDLVIEKDRIPAYLADSESFNAYVNESVKILVNNSADNDTLSVKYVKDKGNSYNVGIRTRRLSARLTSAWNWFAWDKFSSFANSTSANFPEIEDVADGYLVKSLMKVKGSLPIGQYKLLQNNKVSILPTDAATGKTMTTKEFATIAEKSSSKTYMGMFRLAGLGFLDKITLELPGKVAYVSSVGVKVTGDNKIEITSFKTQANVVGYDYVVDENGRITYGDDGKPVKIEDIGRKEIDYMLGYFVYEESPNYLLIGCLAGAGAILVGLLIFSIVTGRAKRFFRGEKFAGIKRHKMIYLMLIPSAILVITFCYVPMFGVLIAFKDFTLTDGFIGSEWVGLKYFKHIVLGADENVFLVFRNTIYIALIRVATNFPAILIFALMINEISSGKAKSVIRTVSYLPNFISWIAVGGMALSIFSMNGGLLNKVISAIKGEAFVKDWYSENTTIWWIFLAFSSMWKSLGWGTIIYMSALGCINSELYDACSIDGGGRFRKIITVTIPGIANVIMLQLIMDAGNLIRDNYEQVLALTNGSQYLNDSTYIVGSMAYSAVMGGSGYAMATAFGLIQGAIGLVLVILTNGIAKKTDNEGVL